MKLFDRKPCYFVIKIVLRKIKKNEALFEEATSDFPTLFRDVNYFGFCDIYYLYFVVEVEVIELVFINVFTDSSCQQN
jgi:hypothetical protein